MTFSLLNWEAEAGTGQVPDTATVTVARTHSTLSGGQVSPFTIPDGVYDYDTPLQAHCITVEQNMPLPPDLNPYKAPKMAAMP